MDKDEDKDDVLPPWPWPTYQSMVESVNEDLTGVLEWSKDDEEKFLKGILNETDSEGGEV